MSTLKIIVFVLFLLGCNFSKTSIESRSFDSKVSDLFFNANIKTKYDNLVEYFKTISNLKEFEGGWTLYPPLSALGEEDKIIEKKFFEFHTYLDISSELKSGFLEVRRFSPTKESLAVLEINLEFKLLESAKHFYKKVIEKFNTFRIEGEKSPLETFHFTVIHDSQSESVLNISVFETQPGDLYAVTLRLIVIES